METLVGLIRTLIESTWRIGIPLAIGGAAVIGLHRFNLPEPGVLAPYLGWATLAIVAGVSFTAVAAGAGILSAIRRVKYRKQIRDRMVLDLKANVTSLTAAEFIMLGDLLQRGAVRLKVHILSEMWPLVEKGVLRRLEHGHSPMCEVPELLEEHRIEILAAVAEAREKVSHQVGQGFLS